MQSSGGTLGTLASGESGESGVPGVAICTTIAALGGDWPRAPSRRRSEGARGIGVDAVRLPPPPAAGHVADRALLAASPACALAGTGLRELRSRPDIAAAELGDCVGEKVGDFLAQGSWLGLVWWEGSHTKLRYHAQCTVARGLFFKDFEPKHSVVRVQAGIARHSFLGCQRHGFFKPWPGVEPIGKPYRPITAVMHRSV